jgi:hypothetical protein
MNNLFLSFLIAIAVAAGLVFLSRSLHLEFNTSNIFPLIPIFYALVYEFLERITTGKEKPTHPAKAKAEMKAGMAQIFKHITVGRIFTAIGVGLLIKILFEIIFLVVYSQFDYITFKNIYGVPSVETIGKLIKGDHPWLYGKDGFYLLSLLAGITSFGTGLWIGFTSKGNAILEGVFVGAAFTVITAMTNLLILYRAIEVAADNMAASRGYGVGIGFAVVLAGQVLLYGFWAGIAQSAKQKRAQKVVAKKSAKKSRKE